MTPTARESGTATPPAWQKIWCVRGCRSVVLDELCARRLIEKLYTRTYFIVRWRERDESDEKEPC